MLELEDDLAGDVTPVAPVRYKKWTIVDYLYPWARTMKLRSYQNSVEQGYRRTDEHFAVNKFLATVKTTAQSRADKKRNKFSMHEQPTERIDFEEPKETEYAQVPFEANRPSRQYRTKSENQSVFKNRCMEVTQTLPRNNITLAAAYEHPALSFYQDIKFRHNLQKLLKLRDKVKKKKLSVVYRETERRCESRHSNYQPYSQMKVHQIPMVTLDELYMKKHRVSYSRPCKPSKNCFLINYKFLKYKSRYRDMKQQKEQLYGKISNIHRLITCIREKGIRESQLLTNPRLRHAHIDRDRHHPF